MKINYSFISRSLIALLFLVGAIQATNIANGFDISGFVRAIGLTTGITNMPLLTLMAIIVLIIEVPVAIAYAWGYRVHIMGWALIAFTALTILFVHRDFAADPTNMVMTFKNIAIIGGILATIQACTCTTCSANSTCVVTETKKTKSTKA